MKMAMDFSSVDSALNALESKKLRRVVILGAAEKDLCDAIGAARKRGIEIRVVSGEYSRKSVKSAASLREWADLLVISGRSLDHCVTGLYKRFARTITIYRGGRSNLFAEIAASC